MNENPEMGSLWKGRILFQVIAEKTEKPVLKIQNIPQEDIDFAQAYLRERTFKFMIQVNNAIALPEENIKYEIGVRIADKEITTGQAVMNKGTYNRFNFRTTPEQAEFTGPYVNLKDVGTVFVYLKHKGKLGGTKNICFYRAKITEFMDLNPTKIKWVQL